MKQIDLIGWGLVALLAAFTVGVLVGAYFNPPPPPDPIMVWAPNYATVSCISEERVTDALWKAHQDLSNQILELAGE